MDNSKEIQKPIERIELLEDKLSKLSINEAKEVTMTNCSVGDIALGSDCKLDIQDSTVGTVIDTDIDDADSRIDDLEGRLDEVNSSIDEAESRLEELDE